MEPLTPNTQAILLLTAPLIAGHRETSRDLLSLGEYNQLTLILRQKQKQPADLLAHDAQDLIEACAQPFGQSRIDALLGRGFVLSQAVERWHTRGIWVVSRADPTYPRRMKARLKADAPPILYGCGDISLLEKGGLAVVGSRHVDDELIRYTEHVGRLSAEAHRSVVSGGAKGVDRAAMFGALDTDGEVVGVMADSLDKAALNRENRGPLMSGKLALISPYDPASGFHVGHAMQRNKFIYALADSALVVTSDFEKGGTWTGAIEQIDRLRFVPVFIYNGPGVGKGNAALLNRGGKPWPNPQSGAELDALVISAIESVASEPKQEAIPLTVREEPTSYRTPPVSAPLAIPAKVDPPPARETRSPEAELLNTVRNILCHELIEPRTEDDVATLLSVTKMQAKAWIVRFVNDGLIERINNSKPVLFRRKASHGSLVQTDTRQEIPR